jgi:uncharacterized membrane protein YfcA
VFDLIELDQRLAFAAVVVACAGFLRGFVGFGSAMVIVPVLALAYGPRAAVAMHAVMELPAILWLMPSVVRHAERVTVAPMILAMLVATPLGAAILKSVDAESMKIVISTVVLAMVVFLARDWSFPDRFGASATVCAGALGGLMQGATGLGGPPVVAALLARADGASTTRGNILAAMGATILIAFATFWVYGLLSRVVMVVGILAMPVYIVAIGLGSRYFHRGGGRYFRGAVLAVLAVIALASLVETLRA